MIYYSSTRLQPLQFDRLLPIECGKSAPPSDGGPPAAPRSSRVESDIGSEKFSSGKHKGKTFRDVATADPSYHLRCAATGYSPGGIERYRRYFFRYGDHAAAARDENATIAAHLGFVPDCGCFD